MFGFCCLGWCLIFVGGWQFACECCFVGVSEGLSISDVLRLLLGSVNSVVILLTFTRFVFYLRFVC